MHFIVLFEDNPDKAEARARHMPDHLAFLQRNAAAVRAAGPLKDGDEGAGGLWVVEAETRDAVEALVREDPFYPTGLRRSWRVLAWHQVFADGTSTTPKPT